MKQIWKIKQLGEVCNIIGGGTPSKKVDEYYDGDILWATVRDMNEDILYTTEHKITQIGLDNSSSNIIPKDNVIIATRVGLGKVCFLINDTAINQDLKGIIPKNTVEIVSLFLFWWFKNISEQIVKMGTGATVQGVKIPFIESLQFPIPPLEEQKRIVAKLNECFEAIDKARANVEKNLRKTEELHQSLLFQILYQDSEKWEKSILGESCEFFNGKAHEKAIHTDGNYVVVNSKFISRDGKIKKYTREQMFPLFKNDIVMVMSDVPNGKALAKCYLIEKDNTYSLNQRICAIRSENYIHKYLFYQLNRHRHLLSFNNGENQTNLRKNDILNTPLYIPPFDDQEEVVKKLDEVVFQTKSLESNYQQEMGALDELKKSILQKAFNGEL
jgi:type I restriction enzyme S subunit